MTDEQILELAMAAVQSGDGWEVVLDALLESGWTPPTPHVSRHRTMASYRMEGQRLALIATRQEGLRRVSELFAAWGPAPWCRVDCIVRLPASPGDHLAGFKSDISPNGERRISALAPDGHSFVLHRLIFAPRCCPDVTIRSISYTTTGLDVVIENTRGEWLEIAGALSVHVWPGSHPESI